MVEKSQLEFPMDWGKCPYCGEERCVAETVRLEEEAKGKINPGSKSAMVQALVAITDVLAPHIRTVPTLIGYIDACVKCGAARFIHIDRRDTLMGVEMPNPTQPQPGVPQGVPPFFGKG